MRRSTACTAKNQQEFLLSRRCELSCHDDPHYNCLSIFFKLIVFPRAFFYSFMQTSALCRRMPCAGSALSKFQSKVFSMEQWHSCEVLATKKSCCTTKKKKSVGQQTRAHNCIPLPAHNMVKQYLQSNNLLTYNFNRASQSTGHLMCKKSVTSLCWHATMSSVTKYTAGGPHHRLPKATLLAIEQHAIKSKSKYFDMNSGSWAAVRPTSLKNMLGSNKQACIGADACSCTTNKLEKICWSAAKKRA